MIQSSDGGSEFARAQKLGIESWTLDGCPMDGGGLAINEKGRPETVWNRNGVIYACQPGKEEKALGKGKSCTIARVNGKNVYAWVQAGDVIIMSPDGLQKYLGRGELPPLSAINDDRILCVWQNNKQIHKAIINL